MVSHSTPPYTIAFFTTGTELEFSTYLAHMVTKVAKEKNVNMINFLGGSLNPNFSFSQYKYQYQCNVAFNFAHNPHIDGIILASGILASFVASTEFDDFYNQFTSVPLVSLGVNIKQLPSVYTNNEEIYIELVSHLINVHNRRRIAFISGPTNNTDASDRYLGYCKALAQHNIAYNPELVYIGDFTPLSAKEAIHCFIDEKHLAIDAIVCSNDSMALTVITELKKRNIKIPEQIMVTGCDDIPSAAFSVPSLTTIEQSIEASARTALNLLIDTIENKPVSNIVIPSKIIFRESCPFSDEALTRTEPVNDRLELLINEFLHSCAKNLEDNMLTTISKFITTCYEITVGKMDLIMSPYAIAHLFLGALKANALPLDTILNLKDCIFQLKNNLFLLTNNATILAYLDKVFSYITGELIDFILEYYDKQTKRLNQNFSFTRQFLSTITNNINDRSKQLESIIPSLIEYGIQSCLIYLYPKGITHNLSDSWQMPQDIYLYMGFIDQQIIDPCTLPQRINPEDIATYGLINRDKSYISCIHPIFFGNEQLGIGVFELSFENYSLIETLTVEIACALKLSSIFNMQKESESKLEALSQTDELTHLLNRRGFFNLSHDKYVFSSAAKQNGVLFYADMDGLKTINDTYGHTEGDHAIIAMSKILRSAFCQHAIIGRIGGDEFIILCTNQEATYIKEIVDKVNLLCKVYNRTSNKPYELNISIGGIFYNYDDPQSLEQLILRSDKLLYEEKRIKKAMKNRIPLDVEDSLL